MPRRRVGRWCRSSAPQRRRRRAPRWCSTASSATCRRRPSAPAWRSIPKGSEVAVACDPDGKLCAFVFKTTVDTFGKISFFKVLRGTMRGDSHPLNASPGPGGALRTARPAQRQVDRDRHRGGRRRHRRGHQADPHADRRHAVRQGRAAADAATAVAGGDRVSGDLRSVEGRRGQDHERALAPLRGGCDLHERPRPGHQRGARPRPRRRAPRRRPRADEAEVRRRRRAASAQDPLSRDHHRHGARGPQVQEAVRRMPVSTATRPSRSSRCLAVAATSGRTRSSADRSRTSSGRRSRRASARRWSRGP